MENTVESVNVMANNMAAAEQGSWLGLLLYCAVVFGIILKNKKRVKFLN